MRYDVIVIGAGLAGLMAALRQAESGKRVLLLAKGQGATHWSTGCIDVWAAGDSPRAGLEQLLANKPDHPYALAGMAGLEAALTRLRELCTAAGYPLAGDLSRNLLLPTALGALRPTCLLPATMAAGDSRQLGVEHTDIRPSFEYSRQPEQDLVAWQHSQFSTLNSQLLVVGFRELRDFFPPMIAANLRAQGYEAEGVYLELPPGSRRLDITTASLARLFDQPGFRSEIGTQLRQLVVAGGYRRVALPAVLGLERPAAVARDLQNSCGALVFEVPTLPASVPGMRLYTILARAIERAGGRIQLNAEVVGTRAAPSGNRLEAVYSLAAARRQEHLAERFVLATGGIAGGGVRGDHTGTLQETALGLPLQTPQGRAAWVEQRFLSEQGHQVFRCGVATDQQGRPLDGQGKIVYTNVCVAGAALAGVDPVREGCYEGLALATGWVAGRQ